MSETPKQAFGARVLSDLVYKLKKIVGTNNFSAQFIIIISYYKMIGYFATDCMLDGQPNPGWFPF